MENNEYYCFFNDLHYNFQKDFVDNQQSVINLLAKADCYLKYLKI